ncbi:hypothetical protein QX776_17845 [Alteromonadaceae bacterium BrNp21-10]|nr:hypothetical protein [Alteromonadaceae bacterium BrNp21-10]
MATANQANTQNGAATKSDHSSQEKLTEACHLAGEAASDMMDNVKGQAQATYQANKKRAGEVANQAESLIKERPLLSIGCAFVAGWAVSKLLK